MMLTVDAKSRSLRSCPAFATGFANYLMDDSVKFFKLKSEIGVPRFQEIRSRNNLFVTFPSLRVRALLNLLNRRSEIETRLQVKETCAAHSYPTASFLNENYALLI